MKKWLLAIVLFAAFSQPLLAELPDSITCQENYKKSKKFGLWAVLSFSASLLSFSASLGVLWSDWQASQSGNSTAVKILTPAAALLFGTSLTMVALSNKYGNMVQR